MADAGLKSVGWVGSSLAMMRTLPQGVRATFGFAIYRAQAGGKHVAAKPMKGFGGAGVLEVVEDEAGSTYRAIYTVRFARVVYVLHVFQKKSKKGIRTPQTDLDLIRKRLRRAAELYEEWTHEHPEGPPDASDEEGA